MRVGFNLSFLTPIDIHKLPKSTLIHLYLGTFLNSDPPENHTPLKNYERRHHLLMIFHIRKGLLALLANRPFLIWKIISRWAFPYGFWWGYSIPTKLMGVRSFDEFWRGSWKLMGVIRRMLFLTLVSMKYQIALLSLDSTHRNSKVFDHRKAKKLEIQ